MENKGLICGSCAAVVGKLASKRPEGTLTPIIGREARCSLCRLTFDEGVALMMKHADVLEAFINGLELLGRRIRPIRLMDHPPVGCVLVLLSTNGREWEICRNDEPGFTDSDGLEAGINESTIWLPMPPKE